MIYGQFYHDKPRNHAVIFREKGREFYIQILKSVYNPRLMSLMDLEVTPFIYIILEYTGRNYLYHFNTDLKTTFYLMEKKSLTTFKSDSKLHIYRFILNMHQIRQLKHINNITIAIE